MPNPFCHVELNANDLGRAREFYTQLFNWNVEEVPIPGGSYHMINVGSGTGGGMMKNPMPDTCSNWLAYVLVDDLVAATNKARELGATIMIENHAAGDYGWLSIIKDPQGAILGLWKANA